jgi:hypothetical protein
LKDKELESKILHQSYISNFLTTALNQDIELRIRFAEYFSHVSDPRHREGWEKFHSGLVNRRNEIRNDINLREVQFDKLRAKQAPLSIEEQTQRARLERELGWNYAELGYVRKDSNVTAPVSSFSFAEYGRGFNGSLQPVSKTVLSKTLGAPSGSKETSSGACNQIDNPKLKSLMVEINAEGGAKLELIKPAAESLNRIIATMRRLEPELAATLSFVPTKCAAFSGTEEEFAVSAWRVSVSLGGQNVVSASTAVRLSSRSLYESGGGLGFGLGFGGVGSAVFSSGEPGGVWRPPLMYAGPSPFGPKEKETDELLLVRLEAIARYFREERWYWGAGDLIKRPDYFVVSAALFEEWVSKGL